MRQGRGKVGFWHETFVVPAGSCESGYVNMPAYGLGEARGVGPVGRRGERAADRPVA
ncbi:monooxygenase family protein [Streptomyces lydicus]|uniref:monooxygenase family protein n=1 Tax=Streptomyces lydicus TaxID=47763 RepID=UPI00370FA8B2